MKLSTILAFGALLLSDASAAQDFRFRPQVLENNTTWPLEGAIQKIPDGPKNQSLPHKCPMPRDSLFASVAQKILGNKKPRCRQFNVTAGETLSGFPLFPTRQVHAFTFPNKTFFVQSALPGSELVSIEKQKNIWVTIPGGMTVTCYEGNDGLPHCVFRL